MKEDETRRYEKNLDHQSRIERLHQEKDQLQRQLDQLESEANRRVGELEAEREKLEAQMLAKDSEIAKQAQELEDVKPVNMELDMSFHDPAGTSSSSFNVVPSLEIPVTTEIEIEEREVDAVINALRQAGIDLTVFEI